MKNGSPPPALVISLDFELRWGVRDRCPPGHPYERNLRAVREVVPATLNLFEEFGVAATWATVGLLFARSRADHAAFRPAVIPTYRVPELSPYDEGVGADETADPLHFAPTLIDRIRATPRQEIATHTYSHYYCGEPGQTADQFAADLAAARAIAARDGVELESIVFPRNQYNPDYDPVLFSQGIRAYRGNPDSSLWRFQDRDESSRPAKRLARLLDSYLSLTGDGSYAWSDVKTRSGLANVRASVLVRPYQPALALLEAQRLRRLTRALTSAARRGRIIHLWWHPHNFGSHTRECLTFMREVLEEFRRCRDEFGMTSLTMADVARLALHVDRERSHA